VGQQWGSKVSNTSQWGTYGSKLRSCKNLPKRDYKRLLLLHSGNHRHGGVARAVHHSQVEAVADMHPLELAAHVADGVHLDRPCLARQERQELLGDLLESTLIPPRKRG
jgi:hypothetical protein